MTEEESNRNLLEAGTLLMVDSGEYSDYSVWGFFVVLTSFFPFIERTNFREVGRDDENWKFNETKFLAYLLSKGLLLEIDFATLHFDGFNSWSGVEFTPKGEYE